MLVKLLTFGLTSIKDRALGGKGGLNTLSNYLSRTLFSTSWECIHTYMHTYICIYMHTYIHTNAYMHTHKQSGVLSQSRHTSRNGRHYIKVCVALRKLKVQRFGMTFIFCSSHWIHVEHTGKLARSNPCQEEVIMPNS